MFQIMCAFALDVPAAAECATVFHGVSPDVLLAHEPWGHVDYAGAACDRTGAYVHTIVSDRHDRLQPAGLLSQPARSDSGDVLPGGTTFDVADTASSVPSMQPGVVPLVYMAGCS